MRYVIVRRSSGDIDVVLSDAVPKSARRMSMPLRYVDANRIADALRKA